MANSDLTREQILDKIDEYGNVKQTYNALDKKSKELAEEIKNYMRDNELSSLSCEEFKVNLTAQERSKMNEDKLIDRLYELDCDEAIITKEVVDEDKVKDLIWKGVIHESDLEECVDNSIAYVLRVTKKKKK